MINILPSADDTSIKIAMWGSYQNVFIVKYYHPRKSAIKKIMLIQRAINVHAQF
jgi:hypothetical protein